MNQHHQILEALKAGEIITPLDALRRFGSFRASERIRELKKLGHNIVNLAPLGKPARYKLIPPQTITLPPAFTKVETQQTLL